MKLKISVLNIRKEFEKLTSKRKAAADLQAVSTVRSLTGELVSATPIDTGAAQEAWTVERSPYGFNIRNSVPYIQYLNHGSSKQAPSHFIEFIALRYGKPLGTIVEEDR